MSAVKSRWQGRTARVATLSAAVVLAVASMGCTAVQGINEYIAYNDPVNDFVLGWRNSVWARQAWILRRDGFAGQPYLDHFGAGFIDGYMSVASGGNGCTPALPPRQYWSWKYQTAEGQGKVAAWFSGFPHGAKAAEEDGAGNWSEIQVSETLRQEYRLGHEPPFMNHVYLYDPAHCCPPGIPPGQVMPPLEQPLDPVLEQVIPGPATAEPIMPAVPVPNDAPPLDAGSSAPTLGPATQSAVQPARYTIEGPVSSEIMRLPAP